jgi:hypothetical protein
MSRKSSTTYVEAKLELDNKLAEKLQEIGLISGIADLSRACGKNPTYFACMRKRGYGLHIGSLAFLMARYSRELHQSDDVRERARLRMALTAINEVTQEKCRLRELELLS